MVNDPIAETYTGNGLIIHVLQSVSNVWQGYRQIRPASKEACGILICTADMDGTRLWIQSVTKPRRRDRRGRRFFSMRDGGHQNVLDRHNKQSAGKRHLLGTWHTHPEPTPSPSRYGNGNDYNGWQEIMVCNPLLNHFCFAIIGTHENKLFVPNQGEFIELHRRR